MTRWALIAGLTLVVWCSPSAWAGFDQGQELYRLGRYQEAIDQWRQAAESGDRDCQYRLAQIYMDGVIAPRNYATAAKYLKPAALAGHAEAQLDYASLLENGWGVPRARKEAADFYLKAAERGVGAAMFNIAAILESGDGVKSDVVEALKWYDLAIDHGMDRIAKDPRDQLAERMNADELAKARERVATFKPVAWRR